MNSKRNITRRNFIKLALLSTSVIPAISLNGCTVYGNGKLTYKMMKDGLAVNGEKLGYRFVIYSKDKDAILVYDSGYYGSYAICLWKEEGDSLYLTGSYYST